MDSCLFSVGLLHICSLSSSRDRTFLEPESDKVDKLRYFLPNKERT